MICLDTNAVISLLNDERSPLLPRVERAAERGQSVMVSSIVLFELWYGVEKSARPERNAHRIFDFMTEPMRALDFDAEDAREAGNIRAMLGRAGTPIGPYDILIAAQARRRDALLITANGREFARVAGLRTEDWTTA